MNAEQIEKREKVAAIFRSMDEGKECVNVEFAQKWLNENKSTRDQVPQGIGVAVMSDDISSTILEDLNVLKERRNDLVSMLVLLKYTWNNANLIFDSLINNIKAEYVHNKINPCGNYGFESSVRVANLLLDIKYVAKDLYNGQLVKIIHDGPDDLHSFFLLLGQICKTSELGSRVSYFEKEPASKLSDRFEATALQFKNSSCPVIITGDADIDAAVDSVCKSICQSEAAAMLGVSHILIEESVYKQTALLLEDKIKRIKHGSRFDKRTEVQLTEASSSVVATSHHNLKVFSPCEGSPIKLCMGWNPKDINQTEIYSKSNGYITVIPYRNLSELKTLIKDNFEYVCPASIWSESIAATKMESSFQFSPLWINCHGLYHPLYPHYTNYLFSQEPSDFLEFARDDKMTLSKVNSSDSEILQCLDLARKAYLELQKNDIGVFVSLRSGLEAANVESNSCSCCRDCHRVNLDVMRIKSVLDNMIGGQISKTQVTCLRKPVGIVCIICLSDEELTFTANLKQLVASALTNGNSVIVMSLTASVNNACKKALNEFNTLPKGFLNFCCTNNVVKCLFSRNNDVPHVKVVIIGSLFVDDLIKSIFDADVTILSMMNSFCPKRLLDLTTTSKCVWIS